MKKPTNFRGGGGGITPIDHWPFISENSTRQQFSSGPVAEKDWKAFSQHLLYLTADFSNDEGYKTLHTLLGDICVSTKQKKKEIIFYLAVPPVSAQTIIEKLGQHKLCTGTFDPKIVMEDSL